MAKMVKCNECGKKFYNLRAHLKAHGMGWRDYYDKYGIAPSWSFKQGPPEVQKG